MMTFQEWKDKLVTEIEVAAEWQAEKALADADDPRIEAGQKALFALAGELKALPADDAALIALWNEEQELATVDKGDPGEAPQRYFEAKEGVLRSIGFAHEPFPSPDQFLRVLRNMADETITEFRLG